MNLEKNKYTLNRFPYTPYKIKTKKIEGGVILPNQCVAVLKILSLMPDYQANKKYESVHIFVMIYLLYL